jgi:hypothetical protein
MQDRPTTQELLEAVRHFLEMDVVAALEGTKRFHARVAANVLAIVGRELALESQHLRREWHRLDSLLGTAPMPAESSAIKQALRERTETLCDRIRRGDADAGAFRTALLDHVRQTVLEKLAIDNPKLAVDPADTASRTSDR